MLWTLDFSMTKIGTVLVLPKYMVNRIYNVIAQSFCCSIYITLFVIVFFWAYTNGTPNSTYKSNSSCFGEMVSTLVKLVVRNKFFKIRSVALANVISTLFFGNISTYLPQPGTSCLILEKPDESPSPTSGMYIRPCLLSASRKPSKMISPSIDWLSWTQFLKHVCGLLLLWLHK